MSQKNRYEVSVSDGKYTFYVADDYRIGCLRHGEPWIDEFPVGNNAIFSLIAELSDLRAKDKIDDDKVV